MYKWFIYKEGQFRYIRRVSLYAYKNMYTQKNVLVFDLKMAPHSTGTCVLLFMHSLYFLSFIQ